MVRFRRGRTLGAAFLVLAISLAGAAQEIAVDPTVVVLDGSEATYSLLISTISPSGVRIDLTRQARYRTLTPRTVAVSSSGVVRGVTDGAGQVQVEIFEATFFVDVTVRGSTKPRSFHFERDIEPILAKSGCNSSGCHGKAEGQNGFKLSVFGFDPDGDYNAIVKEARGRRVTPAAPEQSLLVTKAIGAIPHGGGQRVRPQSWSHRTLSEWIGAGLPRGAADAPSVAGIRITPRQGRMRPLSSQQLRVVARYTDGRELDVTQIAQFQSNNEGLASVGEEGLVTTGKVPGQAAVMATFGGAVDVFRALIPRDERIESFPDLPEYNFIDGLVYAQLRELNILPSDDTDDAEFLRRVYLDIIGTLPTAAETRRFLAAPGDSRERRARLVDALLERPEYATYWALKWSDLLRIDSQNLGHKAAYSYYRWLLRSFAENKPIARIARELLTVEGPLTESSQGYFFKVASSPGSAASTVSQTLLGVRIECAQCHHHPFDRWGQTDYYGMAAYFTQVKWKGSPRGESLIVEGSPDVKHPRTGEVVPAHPLGEPVPERSPTGDRRGALADWMTAPENPWFARNIANRLWADFMGRGIVDPVDDVRATNPPTNPLLLDALARHFVEKEFDLKELIRAITGSRIYQLSSRPNSTNVDDEQNYSRALLRRMNAEVLFDAVCQVTGVDEKFHGVASGYRAIELWDSKVPHYFLQLFGRPTRQSACVCERNSEPTPSQVLHFLNSESIHTKIQHDAGTVARLVEKSTGNRDLVDQLYVVFFSRFPTEDERRVCLEYFETFAAREGGRRRAAEDLAWSLLNSLEFIFNH